MNSDFIPVWLVIYFGVAVLCIPLVSALGPVSIKNYVLEHSYDESTGVSNIAYRMLAPILCCYIMILIFSCFLSSVIGDPLYSWLSVLLYWAAMVLIKGVTNSFRISILAFILEVAFSILIAVLFDATVMKSIARDGIEALDNSNIAFQLELAMFFVVVQVIASIATRHEYRIWEIHRQVYEIGNHHLKERSNSHRKVYGGYCSLIDTSEAKLFEYERRFGKLLDGRFASDPILRIVFYAIMAIEDANRPATVRLCERIACMFGAAKTTGIMQQKSDTPLTDEESVILAKQYIEAMWDKYLSYYAKSKEGGFAREKICFSPSWYQYEYEPLISYVEASFGKLYGEYCGTRLLDVSSVFHEVRLFQERNRYGLTLDKVAAPGSICLPESAWLSLYPAYWVDSFTIRSVPEAIAMTPCLKEHAIRAESKSFADMEDIISEIKGNGYLIYQVSFSDQSFAKLSYIAGSDIEYTPSQEGWTLLA